MRPQRPDSYAILAQSSGAGCGLQLWLWKACLLSGPLGSLQVRSDLCVWWVGRDGTRQVTLLLLL